MELQDLKNVSIEQTDDTHFVRRGETPENLSIIETFKHDGSFNHVEKIGEISMDEHFYNESLLIGLGFDHCAITFKEKNGTAKTKTYEINVDSIDPLEEINFKHNGEKLTRGLVIDNLIRKCKYGSRYKF